MPNSDVERTDDGFIKDFNPIDFPAFPPTDQEQARAIAYAKAKAAGRLAELPASWNADGTIKEPGEK